MEHSFRVILEHILAHPFWNTLHRFDPNSLEVDSLLEGRAGPGSTVVPQENTEAQEEIDPRVKIEIRDEIFEPHGETNVDEATILGEWDQVLQNSCFSLNIRTQRVPRKLKRIIEEITNKKTNVYSANDVSLGKE